MRTDGRTFDLSGAPSSLTVLDDGMLTFDYTHTFGGRTITAGLELTASLPPAVRRELVGGRFVCVVLSWDLALAAGHTQALTIAAASTGGQARTRLIRPPSYVPARG